MAMWERHTHKLCPNKGPSFSSSLLDAVYRSIDETNDHHQKHHRNNAAAHVEEDIESLRRAIMIEKWMETHTTSAPRHFPSNSASSTDSSLFSSSENDSPSPKPPPLKQKTKKLYGDSLKKVKEPSSPGGKNKIASFLNSIFSPRNLKTTTRQCVDEMSSMRKSRSMKDTTTTTTTTTSRSCLSKNASSRGSKSKRSVRFCPVSTVINVDQDYLITRTISVGAQKNIDIYDRDLDNVSCASSDLFELENISAVARVEEELPVYETTTLQFHHSHGQLLM